MPTCLLLLLLAIALPSAARAAEGVAEINHSCALRTGCFSGDTAGYPVTITRAGSYRLTGNLETGSKNVTGIEVRSSDVSVDLNGFTVTCTLQTGAIPSGCVAGTGTGDGVVVDDPLQRDRVSITNGVVRGVGNDGVAVGEYGRIARVTSSKNGGRDIYAGFGSHVSNSQADGNGGDGIIAIGSCNVIDSVSIANGGDGIEANSAACRLSGNVVNLNSGYGLVFLGRSGYVGNVVIGNTLGTIAGSAIQLGPNVCGSLSTNASTTCP